ncbi:amidophosphoribosyltransferase [Aureispira anguillae]|uniref:Class II glutamine amidotransferase n=1 Tax=Aureispira anguillae TaxID=2864201 RepID=A0A915YKR8_9BACT|nr:class II glutamine amidotransferase [Aureispira anguillae]BDS14895.1 class II glutamine amidotransferase [Aureispira anguillae]
MCGIAFIRLKKPIDYFLEKYGTPFYGINKLYLLLEKQHNRGQDGVGVANIKLNALPGKRYISRYRSISRKPIQDTFEYINKRFKALEENSPHLLKDVNYLVNNEAFMGEVFLGHLRYGTYGKNSIESCHPFLRQNSWRTRNLVVAGNFNLTNVDELFDFMVSLGQHPKEKADTVTVLEKIGHFLDVENQRLFDHFKAQGYNDNREISALISKNLDTQKILQQASGDWDGGYLMTGMFGNGDAFIFRDPNGIRPGYWYEDDEVVVAASERAAIQTAFNVYFEEVKELKPGHALLVNRKGEAEEKEIIPAQEKLACSFERIYFSRGSDQEIYQERLQLGRNVSKKVFEAVNYDFENTVFSYIPNTAEVSFFGMTKAAHAALSLQKLEKIRALGNAVTDEDIEAIMSVVPRAEKIAIKDAKLRTFITQDDSRDDLVAHVYDVTYGVINDEKDTLVLIDDSIVRGTTLRQSILRIVDRLNPKKIIIVSSAPQIRYPDCYGIDMAKLGDFVAFRAAIALLKDNNKEHVINDVYKACLNQINIPRENIVNHVKRIYEPFTDEEISTKIAELLQLGNIKAEVQIIYQSIEGLKDACPNNKGDWYFSGNYPTAGGNKVVNKAFINYMEGINERAY